MRARRIHFLLNIDVLYTLILACASSITLWIVMLRLPDKVIPAAIDVSRLHPAGAKLGFAMTAMAISVLIWRVWMASRYRPHDPVSDKALPTVTVVIPAFNEGCQILATVRSVMASSYPPSKLEVIGVDDGSIDDTWQWMVQARDEFPGRLQLVRQPENRGKRQALMAGFRRATGSIYVTIDSDSEVLPETLRHLVSPFALDRRVGGVAGNVRVLNHGDGIIPKMMEVFFTMAFDFTRSGQSVFGGVICSPGALSAYRASVLKGQLSAWSRQTFMGRTATIGEDRALTNCVLGSGYRVVYQREAVVLTKIPGNFSGLRRMLVRWSRSNVRESLVMASFMFRRFRQGESGEGWLRLTGILQLIQLTVGEALKVGLVTLLIRTPAATLSAILFGCLLKSVIPAVVYQIRYRSWFGWRWATCYSFYWVFALSWISLWGLFSAPRSGWLTRNLTGSPSNASLQKVQHPVTA